MPHDHPPSPEHNHPWWLYAVIIVVLVGLGIWGVVAYRGHKDTAEAQQKAEQLQQSLASAGFSQYPSTDTVARLFGTDGGAVCAQPGKALAKGLLKIQLANGAGGAAQRPVVVARDTLQGQLLIMQTYCPEKVPTFQNILSSLHFRNVVRG